MSDPVSFIDAEKILAKLDEANERLARIEGALEAIAAACGIDYTLPAKTGEGVWTPVAKGVESKR